jgi:flagellar hook-length control protein FliK
LASSANAISSSIGAATAAPAVKAQNNDGVTGGDSFADMLAAIDGTAVPEDQVAQPAPAIAAAPLPVAAATTPDASEDTDATDIETQAPDAPVLLAAIPAAAGKPQAPSDKTPSDKASSDKNKAKPEDIRQDPPANDNSAAIPQAASLPVPPPPTATATPAPRDDSAAPIAAATPQAAPAQPSAPQQAANDTQADDEAGETAEQVAAPQAGQVAAKQDASKPAAAKPAKAAADSRKTADSAKVATARPDAAQPQAKAADTGSDAKQADAKPADLPQASARPADAAAPQNNGPQDAVPAVAAAAPANSNTPVAASTVSHEAAAPAPHHGPNLNGMAVEIAAKSQGGTKQFDIRLDPPELGRVEVRLAIDANGKTQAHLTADQPQTLDLLQKDAPALTRALREAGLDVSQDGLNFSLRNQQQQAGHDQQQGQGGSRTWRGNFASPVTNETANTASAYSVRGLGLIDIKV